MKQIKKFGIIAFALLAGFACVDDSALPIITFDAAIKGAYVRVTDQGNNLMDLTTPATLAASVFTYSVEFVDIEQGDLVDQYILDLDYVDNDDTNGENSSSVTGFMSFDASSFETNDAGSKVLTDISISSDALISAVGITSTSIMPGDLFRITGTIIMTDGSERNGDTSSSSINGEAFQGFFDFEMPAGCPSDLEGAYPVVTDVTSFCLAQPVPIPDGIFEGEIYLVEVSEGKYEFRVKDEKGKLTISDWSFGGFNTCYNSSAFLDLDASVVEVCGEVTLSKKAGNRTSDFTFSSVIVGNDWIITWTNGDASSSEQGVSSVTFAGGVPFTIPAD